jgi:hypothetical protein
LVYSSYGAVVVVVVVGATVVVVVVVVGATVVVVVVVGLGIFLPTTPVNLSNCLEMFQRSFDF